MRKVVYNLLLRVHKGAYSSIVLDGAIKSGNLNKRDRAFITALFYGTLERQITLDYVIDMFTGDKPPDDNVRVILRMAVYQIMFMDSIPSSAIVNEGVNLSPKRAKGYVNAVLRNVLRKVMDSETEINSDATQERSEKVCKALIADTSLSIRYSCPEWLIQKWGEEYGDESLISILESSLLKPPDFYIDGRKQDLSCQVACQLFDARPNEMVIDLCAAPGGKSFTIAQGMNNRGRVISCDISEKKLKYLEKTARELGLDIIETRLNDAKKFNADFPKADRVLCDVPCSGLGVIRRKPEIKYKNPDDFKSLPKIQGEILKTAALYVKENGILMYSTCTLSRTENDRVVERFLCENKDFSLLEKQTVIPEKDKGDGFFMAKMKKTSGCIDKLLGERNNAL